MSDETNARVCPGCGARVDAGADRCELCGSELIGVFETVSAESPVVETEGAPGPDEDGAEQSKKHRRICTSCGRKNRPKAVFCDKCGNSLEKSTTRNQMPTKIRLPVRGKKKQSSQEAPGHQKSAPAKPRVGLLLAGGVVLVVVLYGITQFSKSRPAETSPPPAARQDDLSSGDYLPEDSDLAARAQEIRSAAGAEADTARALALRAELVELYAGGGRLDLAGREQVIIAEQKNDADDWTTAGNLHFDWMERQSGPEQIRSAQRAAAAYVKSLEIEPGNLDVRTDLGVAYLNDPASPMLAIRETNSVLESDPNHVQANFNKGVMLIQIGRSADAIEHFELVKSLTDPSSPAHERAIAILEQVRASSG
jgi:ribosomal protein L40E